MGSFRDMNNSGKEKKQYTRVKEEENGYRRDSRSQSRIRRDGRDTGSGKSKTEDRRKSSGYGYRSKTDSYTDKRMIRYRNWPEERRERSSELKSVPERRDNSFGYQKYEYREMKSENRDIQDAEDQARFILTGRNPIREALKNHRDLEKLLVQKGELSGSAMEIVQKAKEQRIMVQVVEKSRLDEIAPQHQGLIAFASAYQYSTVDDILETAKSRNEDPFIIILDGITDPHNLGAIIRTAECAGAHGVIVPQHRSVGLTPAAVKASAGAVEYVKVARVINLNRTIEQLQKKNIWVYALTMEGRNYKQFSFEGGTALVIGAEGEGISRLTAEKCDVSVSIPMKGHLDSLNASVAAGIMIYHVMDSRNKE